MEPTTDETKPTDTKPEYKGCDHTPKQVHVAGALRLMCDCGRWHGDVPLQ